MDCYLLNMIPFNFFKYIYLRDMLYLFCGGIFIGFINGFALSFAGTFAPDINNFIPKYNIITTLFNAFYMFFIIKFVLNEVLFTKYKNIEIITNINKINWKLILIYFIPRLLSLLVLRFIVNYLFSNSINAMIIHTLISTIPDYFIVNYILSRYIKVQNINNN